MLRLARVSLRHGRSPGPQPIPPATPTSGSKRTRVSLLLAASLWPLAACASETPAGRMLGPSNPDQATHTEHPRHHGPHAPFAATPQPPSPPTGRTPLPDAPLGPDEAAAWSLRHSPALQALVARSEALVARERAAARPGLLGFSIERLTQGDEVEFGRTWSLGLVELLSWPWRHQAAERRVDAEQQRRAREVLQHLHAVRTQWVQAVASRQRLGYQTDVLHASSTAAELARRMQQAGHFSAAQTARHLASESEARLLHSQAQRQAQGSREALVRLMGLTAAEATRLQLPERLPPVPETSPWQADRVSAAARQRRLDLRLAEARWRATQSERRDNALHSVVDVEAGWRRDTSNEAPPKQGPELEIRLAAIDFGAARRQAARLEETAALAEWQASALKAESQLRDRLSAHQAALSDAQQAAQVLAPVRKRLLDERLKQYNGMLIGPFDLLDEARAHVGAVITALEAQRAYWLADAALVAAIDGLDSPDAPTIAVPSLSPTTEASH